VVRNTFGVVSVDSLLTYDYLKILAAYFELLKKIFVALCERRQDVICNRRLKSVRIEVPSIFLKMKCLLYRSIKPFSGSKELRGKKTTMEFSPARYLWVE